MQACVLISPKPTLRSPLPLYNITSPPSPTPLLLQLLTMGSLVVFMRALVFMLSILMVVVIGSDDSSLANQCSNDLTKMTNCMDFATGKKDTPTSECCSSVTDIRSKEPVCLCYIIKLTHGGSSAITNLGLQMSKLLDLPRACKLLNTSVSDCPKLLKLPPNSSDAAIFTNVSAATSGSSSGSATTVSPSSAGVIDHIMFVATLSIIVASSAILLSIF